MRPLRVIETCLYVDDLEAENKRYQAQRKRLRDGLRDILRLTRALRNANAP